jgi:hypothetical protein
MTTFDDAIDQVASAPALDPFDAAIDQVSARSDAQQRLRASTAGAIKQNPDEYAQAKQLAASTGVPAPVIARNLPEAQARARVSEFDQYLDRSPKLATALSQPDFAKVAHDDTENLAKLEAAIEAVGAPGFRETPAPEPSFVNVMRGLWTSFTEGGRQMKLGLEMQAADLVGGDPTVAAEQRRQFEQSQGIVEGATPGFQSATAEGLYGGLASTLRAAPGIAAAIALRSPAPALGAAGVQTEAEAYGKYRARGASPGEAAVGGLGEGGVEVATELLPMSFLVKRFGKEGTAAFLGGLLARDLPSEQVATLAQDAIDTAIANPDKTWGEYLQERPDAAYKTALATLVQSGLIGAASAGMGALEDRQAKAEQAAATADALDQVRKLAEASLLRERDPQSFEQFINAAAAGSPIEELHIDAQALQQAGVDLEALAQVSPAAAAQMQEALLTGGDIVVPVGEYAARIVGTPLDAKLTPHLRTSEDALSLDDSQKFFQSAQDDIKKAADAVAVEKAEDIAWQASATAVEAKLLEQLEGTGRFTKDVNAAYATLMRDFYVATADRLGITPEEMFTRYPIQVKAEGVQGESRMDQGVDTPAFKAWFGESKVVSPDGKPLVVYHSGTFDENEDATPRIGPEGFHFGTKTAAEMRDGGKRVDDFIRSIEVSQAENDDGELRWFWSADGIDSFDLDGSGFDSAEAARADAERVAVDQDFTDTEPLPMTAAYITIKSPKRVPDQKDNWTVAVAQAKAEGHDGIVYRNEFEDKGKDSYIVFDPTQIKSAIGNSGAFDPNNPSILAQGAQWVVSKFGRDNAVKMAKRDGALLIGRDRQFSDVKNIPAEWVSATEDRNDRASQDRIGAIADAMSAGKPLPPIIVDSVGRIIDGHHRFEAAKKLGITSIPVVEAYESQEQITPPVANATIDGTLNQDPNNATRTNRPELQGEQDARTVDGGSPRVGWAEATRIRRKDGSPAAVFRGASRELTAGDFAGSALGAATGHPSSGLGVWFTTERDDAARYGEVATFHLDIRNPKVYRDADIPAFDSIEQAAAFREQLRAEGFDGIAIDYRGLGGPLQLVAFDAVQAIYPPAPRPLDMGQFFQSVYHGSMHKFDKFDLSKIGTGEGAQAYGWGIYFADLSDVAKGYAPRSHAHEQKLMRQYQRAERSGDYVTMTVLEDAMLHLTPTELEARYSTDDYDAEHKAAAKKVAAWLRKNPPTDSHLYVADIPEDALPKMLVWDAPLKDQPDGVRAALERVSALPASAAAFNFDGEQYYLQLAEQLGGHKAASEALQRVGIPGLRYLDAGARGTQIGDKTFNTVVWDQALLDRMSESLKGAYEQGARGEFTFSRDLTRTTPVITLFENADLSTLLHEMGHFQLEVLMHIAQKPDAPAEIAQDVNALLKWFGVKDLQTWQGMSLDQRRESHEKFARGFEAYLFEGKAPNAELRSLFQRFRAWLVAVYRNIKALNVELNDEVRGVFDRLVATEDAIKAAEAERGMTPLFTDPTQVEGNEESQAATNTAIEQLQKRSLRDMKWLTRAKGRALKELQEDAATKREAVAEEITAEVRQQPVYAVQRFLRYGELPEGTKAVGAKLDLDALRTMYGEGPAAPWRYLPTGKAGLAGKEGLHPDVVAEMFGFSSGDQMVRDILAAEPEAELVEPLTDRRMLERYGDISSPTMLAAAADEAVHNEARARFVAGELKAITQATGPARTIVKAAQAFAEAIIARKKVRDIKPRAHATAETRASRNAQAAMAAGDVALAATEKRNQLVQNISTRLSYEALTEIERAVKYLRKFNNEGTREKLDTDYLDQIDQLLERYDLRAISNKEVDNRKSLLEWVEAQREQGFEPDIPPQLIANAQRTPYRELTLEALRGLVDTVKQVEHLGRLKHKLLTAKDEREFAAIRDEIAASIEQHAQTTRDNRTRQTTGAMLASAGANFLAMHRKMASLAREMDGFEDGGPVWEYFIRSMNNAGDAETERRAAATAKLYGLVKPLLDEGSMGGKGVFFPTLGTSFNREERIAIALNVGNAGNLQRLLDGEGWSMEKLQPLLDTITPDEAKFVQAVWDFFESYRPEIGAKEKRIYGKEPEWVESTPITLGGQNLRGGYYPVKYDTQRSGRAEAHADAEAAKQQMRGAYTSATTRRSFTKARAEAVKGRPLLYSFAGIYQGANEVIHDLSWHEWLIDANRLLRSLDGVMRTHYGPETTRLFKKAIEDIAAGDQPAANVFERGLNHVRTGATIAGLGWNLTTSLLQPLGLTQSAVRIGPQWVAKGAATWIKAPLATMEDIYAKSDMMKSRGRTMQREINEIQNQVRGDNVGPVKATFFTLIQKMQLVADVPTWLGAYEKAIAEGQAEERAVALADQAVLDAQGGGQTKDLSEIQRGSPALKLFTNFYSFFNVAYNLGVEKTKQKGRKPKQYPSLALDYLLLYSIPAALASLLKAAITPGDEEDLPKKIAADQISYVMGLIIGAREAAAAVQAAAGVEQFKGSYGGPAGLRLFQEIDKLGDQIAQGDIDATLLKAANNVAGIVFHYPSGQMNRTAEGAVALIEGDTGNPAALVVGPPK